MQLTADLTRALALLAGLALLVVDLLRGYR